MKNQLNYLVTMLLLVFAQFGFAQKNAITGTVSDNIGPLPGASVVLKGSSIGTATDFDGNFSINADVGDILVVSYTGYATLEVRITEGPLIILMQEDVQSLEEVVITAQGISKSKKALGYAITKVTGEELENKAESDVARSLQGKVAGVQIINPSGSTGSEPSIRIRSSLSLTQSNSPLIVVNNVPFNGSLIDINPNDIKELNVLKGLNASLLYGSEGRNGVILIQTKSGSGKKGEQSTKVSLSQTVYTNTVANLPEYQNKYGQGSDGTFAGGNVGSWGPAFSDLDFVPHPYAAQANLFPQFAGVEVPYEAVPNNIRDFFNTGIGTVTAMNIATSQEKSSFNMSAGYTEETGIIGDNDLKRFNIGIGGQAQVTDKLNIAATLNYSTRKRNSQSGSSIFDLLLYLPRNVDVLSLPSENPQTGGNAYYRADQNPLWLLNNTGRNDDVVRIFGTVSAEYKFNDNISLTYRTGYDSETGDEFDFSNKGGVDDFEFGFLELDYDKEVSVEQFLILNSTYQLSEKIGFDSQLGINSRFLKFKSNFTRYDNQNVFGFIRPSNFNSIVAETSSTPKNVRASENLAGAFAQFEFNYDRFLYVTLSGRNDWGSTVEPENRSLFYPGASFSFIPTSAFDFNSKAINYLKLRGAYATSSGFPGRFRTRSVLSADPQRFVTNDGDNVVTNGVPSLLPNPDLRPELHKEFEVGIEGKFFNNRVTLDASAFKRISEDQIVERDLDRSTGYSDIFTNVGRIDTEGLEIDLGVDILKSKNLTWNMKNIFTAYETEVVELGTDQIQIGGSSSRNFAVQGEPLNVLVGSYAVRDSEGNFLINPNNGELIISDEIGLQDRIIGDPTPDWTITNINSVSYKGFSLLAQLEYSHGGENFSDTVEDLIERGVTRDTENREGSFIIPGVYGDTGTGLPFLDANGQTIPNTVQANSNRTAFSNFYNADDLSTFDTSVFRIREIALAYKLDKRQFNKLPFENITFTLSGRNIFYNAPGFPEFTNIDPEVDTSGGSSGTTVPTTKRYALGINISF